MSKRDEWGMNMFPGGGVNQNLHSRELFISLEREKARKDWKLSMYLFWSGRSNKKNLFA